LLRRNLPRKDVKDGGGVGKRVAVYILTNRRHTVLYTGVTSDLIRRMEQHRSKKVDGFVKRYNLDKLVYVEPCPDARSAIAREKLIKVGSRAKKIALIQTMNPGWMDLSSRIGF
jgi:putative endonuclease